MYTDMSNLKLNLNQHGAMTQQLNIIDTFIDSTIQFKQSSQKFNHGERIDHIVITVSSDIIAAGKLKWKWYICDADNLHHSSKTWSHTLDFEKIVCAY